MRPVNAPISDVLLVHFVGMAWPTLAATGLWIVRAHVQLLDLSRLALDQGEAPCADRCGDRQSLGMDYYHTVWLWFAGGSQAFLWLVGVFRPMIAKHVLWWG